MTELANEKIQTLEIPYKFTFLSSKNILLPLIHTNAHLFTQILENLKQYEPYAYPFLQKVSKREVPHYYDTIKNPMDLTTMSKKTYTIKEFKSDLDLIWNNCFYFNGESAISEYAQKMKERADFLFAFYFRDYLNMDNVSGINHNNAQLASANKNKDIKNLNEMQFDKNNMFIGNNSSKNDDIVGKTITDNEFDFKFDFLKSDLKLLVKEKSLSNVFKPYNTIKIGNNSFFNNIKRYKTDKLLLNTLGVKRIIEEIIVIILYKLGYKKLNVSAIRIFSDVVYNFIYKKIKHVDEVEVKNEIENFKLKALNMFCIHNDEESACNP